MMGLSRCFTDWAARKLAFAVLVVQSARTAMAARAAPAVRTKSPVDAECSKMLPSIRQTTEIKQMFATRDPLECDVLGDESPALGYQSYEPLADHHAYGSSRLPAGRRSGRGVTCS